MTRRDVAAFLAGVAASAPFASWLFRPGRSQARPAAQVDACERPRLIIVLPPEPARQRLLGETLGRYLDQGLDEDIAPLAVVDLACMPQDEVELPEVAEGSGPYALLLTSASGARQVRFDLPAPPESRTWIADEERSYDDYLALVEQRTRQRMAAVPEAVRQAVAPSGALDRYWPCTTPRTAAEARLISLCKQGADVPAAVVEPLAPALLAAALEVGGRARQNAMRALARLVRARMVAEPIPGARWAVSAGCGQVRLLATAPEDLTAVAIGCGTSRVVEKSRRFLALYTSRSWKEDA